jgi:hypothetical protein
MADGVFCFDFYRPHELQRNKHVLAIRKLPCHTERAGHFADRRGADGGHCYTLSFDRDASEQEPYPDLGLSDPFDYDLLEQRRPRVTDCGELGYQRNVQRSSLND